MNEIMDAFQTSVTDDGALEDELNDFMREDEESTQPLLDTAPPAPSMKLIRRPLVGPAHAS